MAHGRPWYKRSGGDFVMATLGMPDAETKWAYSACVDMMNDRDRPIADEAGFVCGFTGLSKRKWNSVRAYLIAEGYLIVLGDGTLSNPRFERERAQRIAEQARSIEAGREGGKKSAAKRAAEQRTLDLGAEKQPENTPINGSRMEDKPALIDEERQKSANPVQPPPQPTRAREEARGESIEEESTPTANPTPRVVQSNHADDAGPDEGPWDLLSITNRLARAGAVSLHKESIRVAAVDVVKSWQEAGVDLINVALPAIKSQLADTKEPSIGSLQFYAGRVLKAHADRGSTPALTREWSPEQQAKYLASLKT